MGDVLDSREPPKKPSRRPLDGLAFLLGVACCFIWGLQQVAIKGTGPEVAPLLQILIRTVGALLLVILAQRFWLKEKWSKAVKPWHGLLAGFFYFGEFYFVAEGLRLAPSSHIAVLLYSAPLFAALGLSWAIAEERLNYRQWIGIITSFSGVAFAILYPALHSGELTDAQEAWLLGDLFGLLAGISWGVTTITIRTTPLSESAPTQMLFWQLFGGLLFMVPAVILTGQTHFEPQFWGWTNLIYQAVIVSFVSYLTWCWMLGRYYASRLGVLSFLTPIFAILLSILLLGEELKPSFIVGASLVFGGLLLVQGDVIKAAFKSRRLK